MVITRVPGHPQGSEFGQNHRTISAKVLPCPKGVKINKIWEFLRFLVGLKVEKTKTKIYIYMYI
jgi:hypothetical protein